MKVRESIIWKTYHENIVRTKDYIYKRRDGQLAGEWGHYIVRMPTWKFDNYYLSKPESWETVAFISISDKGPTIIRLR